MGKRVSVENQESQKDLVHLVNNSFSFRNVWIPLNWMITVSKWPRDPYVSGGWFFFFFDTLST